MEVAGPLGTPLGLAQRKRASSRGVGFPGGTSGKELSCQCRRYKRHWFDPWFGKKQLSTVDTMLIEIQYFCTCNESCFLSEKEACINIHFRQPNEHSGQNAEELQVGTRLPDLQGQRSGSRPSVRPCLVCWLSTLLASPHPPILTISPN